MKRVLCVLEQPAKVEHRSVSGKLGPVPEHSKSLQVEEASEADGIRGFLGGVFAQFAQLEILILALSYAAKHQIE
jgi:hypothetical protein